MQNAAPAKIAHQQQKQPANEQLPSGDRSGIGILGKVFADDAANGKE